MMPVENQAHQAAQHGQHEASEPRTQEGTEVLIPAPAQPVDHAALAKSQAQYITAQHAFISGDIDVALFTEAQELHASMQSGVIQGLDARAYSKVMGDLIILQGTALRHLNVL